MYTPDPVVGTLTSTTPVFVGFPKDQRYPATFSLNSAAAGRALQYYSSRIGNNPQPAVIDGTTANQLMVSVKTPIHGMLVTGQAGDTWELR